MKIGDLVQSIGPSYPDRALIIGILSRGRIRIMWFDGDIDEGSRNLFKVIK